MDLSREIIEIDARPSEASESVAPTSAPSPEVETIPDLILQRSADDGASASDDVFGGMNLGDIFADGAKVGDEMRADAKKQGSGPATIKLDTLTATAAATFYTDLILPFLVGGIGAAITGDEGYKFRTLGKKFTEAYRETTRRLIESGEITVPTPMQTFAIMTLAILLSNTFSIWKERGKVKKKQAKQSEKAASYVDESVGVPDENNEVITPTRSSPSIELRSRGRFNTEGGFYVFDLQGDRIKKAERNFGPSEIVERAISSGLSKSEDIKQFIKKNANSNGSSTGGT